MFLQRAVEHTALQHDAEIMSGLVNSLLRTEHATGLFAGETVAGSEDRLFEFLKHLESFPGVLRTNVYDPSGTVIWSSEPSLTGATFDTNTELSEALRGRIVYETGTVGGPGEKEEHRGLAAPGVRFVENYLPVWLNGDSNGNVVGAVEVYRVPKTLSDAIGSARAQIAAAAVAFGSALYAAMFLIVARAARIIREQQAALVAAERLSTAGEMASAVAHGLRNPLASIRSSAELLQIETNHEEARELAGGIIVDADRLEGWIRQFLGAARLGRGADSPSELSTILRACQRHFEPMLARRQIAMKIDVPESLPKVALGAIMLSQIVSSVIVNAYEAMERGGELRLTARSQGTRVVLGIEDTGPGMSEHEIAAALEPFVTTKAAGLGLGLPLARETLERHGGRLVIRSTPGVGTTVELHLPQARKGGA